MKKMWISALLAAAMMTAAGAADTPSAWAQKSVEVTVTTTDGYVQCRTQT